MGGRVLLRAIQERGKLSRQVKVAVVNFAVGNFAEPPVECITTR